MYDSEYASLTDLGRLFNVTCHKFGRWLAKLGLRVVGGDPTEKAKELGLVKAVSTERGNRPRDFYVWHIAKTVALLEVAGYRQAAPPEQDPPVPKAALLVGPFFFRTGSDDGYEVLNGAGEVFARICGERSARFLAKLLNLVDERGKLPPPA